MEQAKRSVIPGITGYVMLYGAALLIPMVLLYPALEAGRKGWEFGRSDVMQAAIGIGVALIPLAIELFRFRKSAQGIVSLAISIVPLIWVGWICWPATIGHSPRNQSVTPVPSQAVD